MTVIDQLDEDQLRKWHDFYGVTADRPRFEEEGVWRRTQQEETAANSGWTGEGDARRRIVHYRHQYGLVDTTAAPALAMTQMYLYHSVAAPRTEIEEAWEQNHAMLAEGGWKQVGAGRFELGDLRVHMVRFEEHPEDLRARRRLPAGYEVIDTSFTSLNTFPPGAVRRRPWEVLTHGVRVKDTPGQPIHADDLAQLTDFLPFQVEAGCGVSYEAGIPPLHHLHEIYDVNEIEDELLGKGFTFVLAPGRDPLLTEMFLQTEDKVTELSEMYRTRFDAEVTPALHTLKRMERAGHMVGPFITDNFDGLGARRFRGAVHAPLRPADPAGHLPPRRQGPGRHHVQRDAAVTGSGHQLQCGRVRGNGAAPASSPSHPARAVTAPADGPVTFSRRHSS
ncbi:hypothetical protein [Streptomyces sp. NPDC059708]|uniref:hypothetical protein n=1 Tax=Streptomyces sp. NPDC059708 TaxID=3346916 RepID=UPI0036AE94D6